MSQAARHLNSAYIALMDDAPADSVLRRVRDLWWPHFQASITSSDPLQCLNRLDAYMDLGRVALLSLAQSYGRTGGKGDGAREVQLQNQFLKSNTGKMFERFVGMALAAVLARCDAPYCVQPFTQHSLGQCHGLNRDAFKVFINLGPNALSTHIDADLIAFNPDEVDSDIFMVSIKSTLKDRFHNVPFWNLLRLAALNVHSNRITAQNSAVLGKMKYIAICSDLANEQPDFGSDTGARQLLRVDAALLDGAYVTSSRARGVADSGAHLGTSRSEPFYFLSCFGKHLCGIDS
ncbi:MAG: hypothetical protein KDA05_09125 [Phycisphaerales bacterium]|nr:hypothetical protein [Phycisphaerales bacterium]